ncbi:MAG: site-2 protease family protein [Polyangiaceae bacterium]
MHEFAHAFVATKLGDDTPEREGRLTLSPAAHIDLLGTIILPTVAILTGGAAFLGWAKPVNVSASRFRRDVDMRRGMALTAFAGPASNLLLATISIALLAGLSQAGLLTRSSPTGGAFIELFKAMFFVNVGLFVFNMLPIPPLDGSRLLPRSFDPLLEKAAPYSFLLVMVILMVPPLRAVLITVPMTFISGTLLSVFGLR